MLPAIFLDRDGVINEERKDYVKNLNEFKIFSGVAEAIDLLPVSYTHLTLPTILLV